MHHAIKLLNAAEGADVPATLHGGLVPHAAWMYSGAVAARTFKLLESAGPLETVVLLGADHTGSARGGEVYDSGAWRTPLGDAMIDEQLAARLIDAHEALRANPDAHKYEHSIEVQVPLLQAIRDGIRIVPITVSPLPQAVAIGRAIGEVLRDTAPTARIVGSSDLTHHGGTFGSPGGQGQAGVEWSVRNDRRLLELVERMDADAIVPEANARGNACGAGAIAATVAACRAMGAARGYCVGYTNSHEVMKDIYPNGRDYTTVGYASVVFG
jgi:hypothetical protein